MAEAAVFTGSLRRPLILSPNSIFSFQLLAYAAGKFADPRNPQTPMPPDSQPPPVLATDSPVNRPPSAPAKKAWSLPKVVAILLSLCLGLFLADGLVSLADDSLIVFFGVHLLAGIRGLVFFFAILAAIPVYGLMGLTPMIPKRFFFPVTLFSPLAMLSVFLFLIYFYRWLPQVTWSISFCQVVCGLIILACCQGGLKFRWPLVPENQLGVRRFGWLNLVTFVLLNLLVLLPAVVAYLVICTSLAVGHFSDGFLALRPGGLSVQVRKYVRNDGKTIQLVPMAHVGDPDFYRKLTASFPTNAIVLMEGVTDEQNLLTNKISYKRMAASLGLAEQRQEFKLTGIEVVPADADVGQFTTNTIAILNLVMRIHAKGLDAGTLAELMQWSPTPEVEAQLFDDLLTRRNQHLFGEIQTRLAQPEMLIVPWGAAHMPGIAKEIQKSGFRLDTTQEYFVIRFHGLGKSK
jgi:hypothetical protein